MAEFVCPLCKHPVSKAVFDKITGIWTAKKQLEEKIKARLKRLQEEKVRLKKSFLQKQIDMKAKLKDKAKREVESKTKFLSSKILRLNREKEEINRKAEARIHKAIHNIENREKKRFEKQIASVKRELALSTKQSKKRIK